MSDISRSCPRDSTVRQPGQENKQDILGRGGEEGESGIMETLPIWIRSLAGSWALVSFLPVLSGLISIIRHRWADSSTSGSTI